MPIIARFHSIIEAKCNKALSIEATLMSKKVILGMIVMILSSQMVGALAQDENGYTPSQVPSVKGESVYGTPPPGQVGGPILNHPELNTPERLKEETEAVKKYCRSHDCSSAVVEPRPGGESVDRAQRAWAVSHPSGVVDPSKTIVCEPDPAHPTGPDICYRMSDHSRVYPGTPGEN